MTNQKSSEVLDAPDFSEELAKHLLRTVIETKNKDGLHAWIERYLGLYIPREKICPDHDAPFDFVCDYVFDKYKNYLVLANRSGGKTLDFAALDAICSYNYDKVEIATVGAIKQQAQKCYSYFVDFLKRFPFVHNLLKKPTMNQTGLANESSVQVLTGTVSGVNSPHPQLLFFDEIDLMAWFIVQQGISMAQSAHGIRAKTVFTSTRKFARGSMQRLMDESTERGLKLYQWCIWEVAQKLPTDNPELMQRIEEQFEGELPARIYKANGYYDWEDIIDKRKSLDIEMWEAEWLCRKPGLEGVIYGSSFIEDDVVLPITGEEFNPTSRAGYLYLFEDFGFGKDHPDVILFCHINYEFTTATIFDELYLEEYGTDDIIQAVLDRLATYGYTKKDIRGWIPDPHGLTEIADRKKRGLPVMDKVEDPKLYIVENGIVIVRGMLNSGKIQVCYNCVNLCAEMKSYRRKKNLDGTYSLVIVKKDDHGPDALRYGCIRIHKLLKSITSDKMNSGENGKKTSENAQKERDFTKNARNSSDFDLKSDETITGGFNW